MSQFSKLLRARTGDKFRVLLATVLLPTLSFLFSVGTFARVRRAMVWLGERGAWIVPGTPTYTRVVSAVQMADRSIPGSRRCLVRSSTAEVLLLFYGFTPEHRIGVAKEPNGELLAHSWIELDGDVILGKLDDLARFDPLPSIDTVEVV